MATRSVARMAACGIFTSLVVLQAYAAQPYQEYRKHIESAQQITALNDELMGDNVSLFNGATEFNATDIELVGNNLLPIKLGRRFAIEITPGGSPGSTAGDPFYRGLGNWDVEVPYISGTYGDAEWESTRCSVGSIPSAPAPLTSTDIWQGNSVHLPGRGDRKMLTLPMAQMPRPDDGIVYKWTTQERDAISCIPMQGGLSGEGFLLTTTEGVKYFFDRATTRYAGFMTYQAGANSPPATVGRTKYYLLASKVVDRFGNEVVYTYNASGHPTQIASNDGRVITLAYTGGLLTSATAHGRVWTYAYGSGAESGMLTSVTRPDGSRWEYVNTGNLFPDDGGTWDGGSNSTCSIRPPAVEAEFTLSVTHPSGAVGSFKFLNARHSRSGVHMNACAQRVSNGAEGSNYYYTLLIPDYFDVMTLAEKTISGPGLPVRRWTYSYSSPATGLWGARGDGAAYPCTTCAKEKTVTVSEPDGSATQYTYGYLYAANEGRLLGTTLLDSGGIVRRTEATEYLPDAAAGDQNFYGYFGFGYGSSEPSSINVRPVIKRTIEQDGLQLVMRVDTGCGGATKYCFDAYGKPTQVTRSNSSFSRTDATTYHNDTTKWILGLDATVTNINTGDVVSKTDYNSNSLPWRAFSFGRLVHTLTYHADGTLASVSDARDGVDGNETTISLSSWKRGIPQYIQFPATPDSPSGANQSAGVNDDGTISSVTDENGFKTCYAYDPMGRLSSITYPSDSQPGCDSSTWSPTTQSFQQVLSSEYGIGPGHWKQTVSTGDARRVTYFDGMWRPLVEESYDNASPSATRTVTAKRYGLNGRLAFQSYPVASLADYSSTVLRGTRSAYDALKRVTAVEQDSEQGVLTTTTEYLSGMQSRVTSPRGHSTTTTYFVLDQPNYEQPISIQHPEGAISDISRDVFGKPKALTRRDSLGNVSSSRFYVYDAHQQLCKTVEPEAGASIMAYDAAGNVSWSASGQSQVATSTCSLDDVASDQMVKRTYDGRSKLRTLTFPDGRGNQTWSYTPDGLPSQIVTNNSAVGDVSINTYTYNKRRMPVAETLGIGSKLWSFGYDYNRNGHIAGHVYPSGLSVDYAPNALGQATKAGTFAAGVAYYPSGVIKEFTYGNGIVHTLTQNARGLPERSRDSIGGVAVHDESLDYDRNGNVIAISDGLSGARGDRDMSYDGLDRLVATVSPMFGSASYAYDVLDNLKEVDVTAGPKIRNHQYLYDSNNRLTNVANAVGGASVVGLGYDHRGNVENKNGQLYDFDFGNRLRQAAGLEQYLYDGHGRRVQAIRPNDGAIFSFYGRDGVLRFQRNERQGKSIDYVQLGRSIVAEVEQPLPLAVPTVSAPSYSSSGSYAVSWSAVTLAKSYQLQERLGSNAWTTIYDGVGSSKQIVGKAAGLYWYQARACHPSGCGAWSPAALTTVELPPSTAPAISAPALGVSGTYNVDWSSVATASDYRLEESFNGGGWELVQSGASFSKSYTGKVAGSYAYRIRACNPAGCGPISAMVTVEALYPTEGVPVLSTPANSATGGFAVTWSSVANASAYRVEEQTNGGVWQQVQAAASTSYSATGKAAGNYGYRVRACNAAGCSVYSNVGSTQVTFAPASAPNISLPSASASGTYTLSWSLVATATAYRLEEQSNGGAWSEVQSGTAYAFGASGKANGTYAYRVRACNVGGCSSYSVAAYIVVTIPPSGIPGLSVPATNNSGSYSVSWTVVTTATSYRLEEQVNGGSWTQVQDSGATSRTVVGKMAGTFGYRVRACNIGGCGNFSASSSVLVTLPPTTSPVLNVPASSLTGAYNVSWTTVSAATRYELEERLNSGSWLRIHEAEAVSKALSERTTGTWSYQVRACNDGGCGPLSAVKSIDVTRPPTSAPVLSVPVSSTSSSYVISWSSVANANRYEVQERFNGGSWAHLLDIAGTSTTVTGKTTGAWDYQVRACNAAGCGSYSGVGSVSVTLPPISPAITHSVKTQWLISGRTEIQCSVSWTSVVGAATYELQVYNGSLQYSGALTSVKGAKNTAAYCGPSHIVRACNIAGCSAWSTPPYTQQVETFDMNNPL